MKRLNDIIADIKDVDLNNGAWIFENGKIRDDVICGDIIPFLEELKEYEVDMTDDEIKDIVANADRYWNTYNWCANISHNIDCAELEIDGELYMAMMVHRYGDVRANYTDRFVVKFNDVYEFYDLESIIQYKKIEDGDREYTIDINILDETYNVYSWQVNDVLGISYYHLEVKDLLEELKELEARCEE